MDISNFNEKLNKIEGNTYVIEEKINLINGIYENELAHDNININTLNIYTGSKLTGDKIETYSTSTPSLTPWKTIIKIFSKVTPLYISYETVGDQVEADDINNLQNAVNLTQEELNKEITRATTKENNIEKSLNTEIGRAKKAESIESARAIKRENEIEKNINSEIERAKASEKNISDSLERENKRAKDTENNIIKNLDIESNRAKKSEEVLNNNLNSEINRAKNSEKAISDNLNNEAKRAKASEKTLTENLNSETIRANNAEKNIINSLNNEINRSKNIENTINNNLIKEVKRATDSESKIINNLNAETKRAKLGEKNLSDNLETEVNRAKNEEKKLADNIDTTNINLNNEVNRAKKTEAIISNNLNDETSRAKATEKVLTDKLSITNVNLENEVKRSTESEKALKNTLNSTNTKLLNEVDRAKEAGGILTKNLNKEINRAKEVETSINRNLDKEINRSKSAENDITSKLNQEINRAKIKENNIEGNINNYKTSNNVEIQKLKEKDIDLEKKKSNISYVNLELNKRYTKDETFNREEVLQKIKDVIGTAPEALDTLQEIAKALNNDSNFAGTMTKQLSTKVDKIKGKQLTDENYTLEEKNKLVKIENEANKYVHPANHSADIIVENPNKRFTNDTEKSKNLESYNKKHDHNNKSILDGITNNLINNWNDASTHTKDAVRHITGDERKLWNTVDDKLDKSGGTMSGDINMSSHKIGFNKGSNAGTSGMANTDYGYIYGEHNKDTETSRLVIETGDNADDSVVIRTRNMNPPKDIFKVNYNNAYLHDKAISTEGHKHKKSDITDFPITMKAEGGRADFANKLSSAIAINDYNTFIPSKVAQGAVTPIKSTSNAKAPWNNTTSGILIQSNDINSWHVLIFRSGGDGWAYRSYYENKWNEWVIFNDNNYNTLKNKPTKLSQFTNDKGFITQKDIDTSQNHTHKNKSILDTINQDTINKWNTVSNKADKNHTHDDRYYTEHEIDLKVNDLNNKINGKANTNHNHDSSYIKKGALTWNQLKGV
ncbi:hypothetical protein [Clostridium taeniosporum]|uniref:hypothetical protein n=1 Tax=Clostridium taeniosporum TaxID=394958 RepID=UPI00084E3700|nr:hypothetical protein [Clostridium taeniosporum]